MVTDENSLHIGRPKMSDQKQFSVGDHVWDSTKVPAATPAESYLAGHRASGIEVGDYVRIVRAPEKDEGGWDGIWTSSKHESVGGFGRVIENGGVTAKGFALRLLNMDSYLRFPHFVLEKITNYSILHGGSDIKVGDYVRVLRKPDTCGPSALITECHHIRLSWAPSMDDFIGKCHPVIDSSPLYGFVLRSSESGAEFTFPCFILEKVEDTSNGDSKPNVHGIQFPTSGESLQVPPNTEDLELPDGPIFGSIDKYEYTSWLKAKLPDGRIVESPLPDPKDGWEEIWSDRWQESDVMSYDGVVRVLPHIKLTGMDIDQKKRLPMGDALDCWTKDMDRLLRGQRIGSTYSFAVILEAKKFRRSGTWALRGLVWGGSFHALCEHGHRCETDHQGELFCPVCRGHAIEWPANHVKGPLTPKMGD
ncbi:MAG: hypothetical protein ACYTBJ_00510 [Planctomycetota bacterium]|jgi:hypothetical protein